MPSSPSLGELCEIVMWDGWSVISLPMTMITRGNCCCSNLAMQKAWLLWRSILLSRQELVARILFLRWSRGEGEEVFVWLPISAVGRSFIYVVLLRDGSMSLCYRKRTGDGPIDSCFHRDTQTQTDFYVHISDLARKPTCLSVFFVHDVVNITLTHPEMHF